MDENGLIGAEGGMPWRLPDDLRYFRRKTLHKPILMGRRTYAAIGKALPQRDNLVLTRDDAFAAPNVQRIATFRGACDFACEQGAQELVVIGGAQVYALSLPRVTQIYLTRIHAAFAGDTWFPPIDWGQWDQVACEPHAAGEDHPQAFSFIELRRRR